MSHKLFFLACSFAVAFYASASTAAVDNARRAMAIAHQVCLHMGGLHPSYGMYSTRISDWHARLNGQTWKAWVGEEGQARLVVLIPKHGPLPTESDCRSRFSD